MFPSWWSPSTETLSGIEPGKTHVKVRAVTVEEDGGGDLSKARSIWVEIEEVERDILRGTVSFSGIDREGFRNGDRISVPPDCVFDLVHVGEDGQLEMNLDRARTMVGKTVLVGITEHRRRGGHKQRQFVGTVISTDPQAIWLQLRDGTVYELPPDIRTFENALPGEYRLHSSGEVITDPDFTCDWVMGPRLRAL
jgi:hypothetical protein